MVVIYPFSSKFLSRANNSSAFWVAGRFGVAVGRGVEVGARVGTGEDVLVDGIGVDVGSGAPPEHANETIISIIADAIGAERVKLILSSYISGV